MISIKQKYFQPKIFRNFPSYVKIFSENPENCSDFLLCLEESVYQISNELDQYSRRSTYNWSIRALGVEVSLTPFWG